jgi:ABC-type Fe3+/spermidine/putrescine transport system ATPase subunit
MDEPLGALDKNLRYEMQVEIKDIQRRLGMTVVYVTHDQEEAMNMSDRIAIMNKGRIEQVGRPTEIYEQPANVFIGRFLGEATLIEGRVDRVDDGIATMQVGNGVILRARAPTDITGGAAASLFVRPERIAIGAPAAASPAVNCATGQIKRVSFLGNIVRYAVEIAPAVQVTVDTQNTGTRRFAVDEPVPVSWAVDDSRMLGG